MRPSEVALSIKGIVEHGNHTPIFIWGPPGVGKSAVVKQVTEDLDIGFIDVRALLLDPTDLRGIPFPSTMLGDSAKGATVRWLSASFMPREERDGERGVFFLDELNAAPPLVQAACYQLVLDRRVGEYILPEGWSIIAAGNRQGDRGVTHRMPSPLANRFVHVSFDVHLDDWTSWAMMSGVAPDVIAFVQFMPQLLFAFDPSRDEMAFPTPRSWAQVSNLLWAPPSVRGALIAGAVGDAAAAQFTKYMECYRDIPDIDAILDGRSSIVPERTDVKWATLSSLAQRAEAQHVDTLVKYSMRYTGQFSVLLVKMLQLRHLSALKSSPTFHREWLRKYKGFLI